MKDLSNQDFILGVGTMALFTFAFFLFIHFQIQLINKNLY